MNGPAEHPGPGRRALLWAEMTLLFVGGPVLLWKVPAILAGPGLFVVLWVAGVGALVYLLRDRGFDRRQLWNARVAYARLGVVLLRWMILAAVLLFFFGMASGKVVFGLRFPAGLFTLPGRVPALWALIMLAYPWVSVFPQNLVYRAFFCQRYAPILPGHWAMVGANAAFFSFGHVMFGNWVVLGLTFLGGLLFTGTYLKHKSLLLATIEHALYGGFCFSVGIGLFLFYGSGN